MRPSCSAILLTRNRKEELEKCLKSIEKQTILPDEVIVVDSSDNSHEIQKLCESFKKFSASYIYTFPPGLTRQRNIGLNASKGEIIFFFDDDIELDRYYIEKCFEVHENKELGEVGVVQGIDLNITKTFLKGRKRLFFYRFFLLGRRDKYAKMLASGNAVFLDAASTQIRHSKKPIRVYLACGGITSYPRRVFNDFMFDETYEGYSHGEDVDFSHRVSKKYKIYFTSEAKVFHNQSPAKKAWYGSEDYVRSSIQGQVYRFRKHLRNNPLNYFAILWSWLGMLIWNGIIHPNKIFFISCLKGMKDDFFNLFRPLKEQCK
jgi:glycosyltransferase involved in cell wall biosynthesis